jgi:hypothetical protein
VGDGEWVRELEGGMEGDVEGMEGV